jgi:hypothetical protein
MNALHPRRRQSDWCPAQAAIEILRDVNLTQDQIAEILRLTVCKYPLNPDNIALIVDALALKTGEMADSGWFLMDDVAAAMEEASGCLLKVKDPSHERSREEEDRHQRELRQFMFEGHR